MSISKVHSQNLLVVIAGPTAVGKTGLAIRLAEHFGSEILSADSRQFYREMNIGTAKPTPDQLNRVKHHFINTKNADELYGAGHFARDAVELMKELFKKHKILFLVGGSGLYIKAILEGVDEYPEVPPDLRENLNKTYQSKGLSWLQSELQSKDPEYYNQVDLQNPQRLIRALEVIVHSGKTYTSFQNKNKEVRDFKPLRLLINLPREKLYQNINERVDTMIKEGLLEEVKQLKAFKHTNALKTVGYQELNDFLEVKFDLNTAVALIKQHSRNYAKRQLTWFRNQGDFQEFSPEQFNEITELITQSLNRIN